MTKSLVAVAVTVGAILFGVVILVNWMVPLGRPVK